MQCRLLHAVMHLSGAVACMKAPVPFLNRALAEEQMGVDADQQDQHQHAQSQYSSAVKVGVPR